MFVIGLIYKVDLAEIDAHATREHLAEVSLCSDRGQDEQT